MHLMQPKIFSIILQCCHYRDKSKSNITTITLIFATTPFSANLAEDFIGAIRSRLDSLPINVAQAESQHTQNKNIQIIKHKTVYQNFMAHKP